MAKLLDGTRIYGTANVDTKINVGANVAINTSAVSIGNSTVNTSLTSTTASIGNGTITVTATGNVGFSNTTPNAKLAVTGTANISGNVSIGGTSTFTGPVLINNNTSPEEGGELTIKLAANTTLNAIANTITIDIYQNKLRIFETGTPNRGVYVDLSTANADVGTSLGSGGFANGQSITVANLVLTGSLTANGQTGTPGQILMSNGTATYWSQLTAGAAVGQGANTSIQFNDSGVTSGAAQLSYDKVSNKLTVGNSTVNSTFTATTTLIGSNSTSTSFMAAANGNVGIANVTPEHTLSVNGNAYIGSTANIGGTLGVGGDLLVANNGSVGGNFIVGGSLYVEGTTTYINTTQLNVEDNIITLNSDIGPSDTPIENAGIEVNRGVQSNVALTWNESIDEWTMVIGSNTHVIASTEDVTTAYSNATSYADTKASQAYSNAATYAQTVAGDAYTNATSYTDTKAGEAYSNAATFAANASNITTGTLNTARLPATANVSTSINVGANVNLTTTSIGIGNSTVNTLLTATSVITTNISGNGSGITSVNAAQLNGYTAGGLQVYANAAGNQAYANAIATGNTIYAKLSGASFTGAVDGVTTLATGNTTVTGFVNTNLGWMVSNTNPARYIQANGTGIFPSSNAASYNLGDTTQRWLYLYANNGSFSGTLTVGGISTFSANSEFNSYATFTSISKFTYAGGMGTRKVNANFVNSTFDLVMTPGTTSSNGFVVEGYRGGFANVNLKIDNSGYTTFANTVWAPFLAADNGGISNFTSEQLLSYTNVRVGDSTTNTVITAGTLALNFGTTSSTQLSPTAIFVGNSTVNATINSTAFALNGVAMDGSGAAANAYANAVTFASNASNITSGTLSGSRLPTSGVTAGFYGNATAIPMLNIDATGRIIYAGTANVAGVASLSYISSNNTLLLWTADNIAYSANINVLTSPIFNGVTTVNGHLSVSGNTELTNLQVFGDLTVGGNTTYINATQLNIGDNIITLNSDLGLSAPTENAGIEINRGTSANVAIRWNESTDKWQFTNDGTTYGNIGEISNTFSSVSVSGELITANSSASTLTVATTNGITASANAAGVGVVIGQVNVGKQSFTGNGSNTEFTLAQSEDENNLLIFINGIYYHPGEDYTVTNDLLNFTDAPADGAAIRVRYLRADVGTTLAGDLSSLNGAVDLQSGTGSEDLMA